MLKLARGVPGAKLKRWKVGCRNKEEAQLQEAIIRRQLLEGLRDTPEPVLPPLVLREYVERWLLTAKTQLAARTLRGYQQVLRLHIFPALGNRRINTLTWADVRAFLNERQQQGLHPSTVRILRAVISSILSEAAEDDLIPVNPLIGQRRKRRASQLPVAEINPLTWGQKVAFEAALNRLEDDGRLSPTYATLFAVYLLTGVRPSEGRALKVGDIDFHGRRLHIERAADQADSERNTTTKNTKTGESRWVDISKSLTLRLERYVTLLRTEDMACGKESEWLFPSETGTMLDERNVVRAYRRILTEGGLPHFRLYDLRHTFASLLLSAGEPLLYVQQQLGHKKPTMTLKNYAKWIPSGDRHRVDVLDSPDTVLTPANVSCLTGSGPSSEVLDFSGGPTRTRT
jgi:integrase